MYIYIILWIFHSLCDSRTREPGPIRDWVLQAFVYFADHAGLW